MNIKAWIKAMRLRTLPLALSGMIVGNVLAHFYGVFDTQICKLSIYTAILLQILSNFANDYGDFLKGTDNDQRLGPQRALQSGAIKPDDMKMAMTIIGFFTFICGSWLVYLGTQNIDWQAGLFFLALGGVAILAAIKYTVGKNAYGYKGLGDLLVFIFFGLVAVAGSFFLQYKSLPWEILLPATAIGCLSVGVLNMNNIRDMENDKASNKITIPVRIGERNAKIYQTVLILTAAFCAIYFQFAFLPLHAAWSLAFLLVYAFHLYKVWTAKDKKVFDAQLKFVSLGALLYAILLWAALCL